MSGDTLATLAGGMRKAVEGVLAPGEDIMGAWATRGPGANALVCTDSRVLIAKKPGLLNWRVSTYSLRDIGNINVIWGRLGTATQIHLAVAGQQAPPETLSPRQDEHRLLAPNVALFRKRHDAERAVQVLQAQIQNVRRS